MCANLTPHRKCVTFAGLKFVDAHVHLSDPEYEEMVAVLMEDAEKSCVAALVSNSMNLQTSQLSLRLAEKHKGRIYAALGIHPWNVKDLAPNELEETIQLILSHVNDPNTVAIGEVGLDPKYLEETKNKAELRELQHKVFHEMLKIAEKTSLPTIIHSRWATQQIVEMLPSYNVKKVLLHFFSKPLELLPEIVSRGYYISEGPPAVYSKNTKEIIKQTPLENLLTETDGPVRYFGKPFKGKTTTPAFIPIIVEAMANTKCMKKDEVALQIYKNFAGFFKIKV
jgi:TatD DNase family protein